MKRFSAFISAAMFAALTACTAPADNGNSAETSVSSVEEESSIVVTNPTKTEREDLTDIEEEYSQKYEDGELLLKEGEDYLTKALEKTYYGVWIQTQSFTFDSPIETKASQTVRVAANGYRHELRETGTVTVYDYIISERQMYIVDSLEEKIEITVDENGSRIWLDENGGVLRRDEDYTDWETTEEITSEEPQNCYEFELNRMIPTKYEIAENDEGYPKIIFHYASQERQPKAVG